MKKFLFKTVLLFFLTIVIFLGLIKITSVIVKSKGFNNYTADSNTLFLKENVDYDILFMGISHARNFSRHKNHLRVEEILESKIANIGQGRGACSINEQLFYLEYFFSKGNTTENIFLILSPPMLFSETLPVASNTFDYEVFELSFLWQYLNFKSENKTERILSYLESKLDPIWISKMPHTKEKEDRQLDSLDMKAVKEGQNYAYNGDGLNYKRFQKSIEIIEKIIRISNTNGSNVYLITPPALFGKWRGHDDTEKFALKMQRTYPNVFYFDASETVLEPIYYYDNHHLNTKGIILFTEKYLTNLK